MLDTLIVLAKTPLAGRVKTRLSPPFSLEAAARLAEAALADTFAAADRVPARRRLLALDGPVWSGAPAGWSILRQHGDDLDERLQAAIQEGADGPCALIGMDTPQLHPDQLSQLDLDTFDACLGPAMDGGFWAIGFREPQLHADVIRGVAMSRPDTMSQQLAAMRARNLRVQLLEPLMDVDTCLEAAQVASQFPRTRFAAEYRRLTVEQAS